MYFANNPADNNFCGTVIQTFLKASAANPSLRMHALVDAGFDEEGFAALANAFQTPAVPVYAETLYSGGAEIGPQLLEIHTASASAAQEEINRLLALRGNRPMLSLWVTTWGPEELAKQWRPFVSAQLEDDSSYLLRFADTRVLHSLITVLTPAQYAHFVPGATQIWMPARSGPYIATASQAQGEPAPCTQLLLDKTQFNTLMDRAEPDAIIDRMTEGDAAAYASAKGADLHSFVSAQIDRARSHHITQTPDLVTYCELAWTMGPAFDQDEAVNKALMNLTPSKRLSEVLPQVPAKVWERLANQQQKDTAKP